MRAVAFYPSFFNTTTEPTIRLAARLAELAPGAARPRDLQQLGLRGERDGAEADPRLLEAPRPARARRRSSSRTFAYHGVDARDDEHDRPAELHRAVRSAAAGLRPRARPARLRQRARAPRGVRRVVPRGDRAHRSRARAPATIAAMFAEPVQGAGGVIVPPPGLPRASCASSAGGTTILFVADEVITGFGRLGAWFASELWDARSRPHDAGEGHHQRLRAARRDDGERRDRRRRSRAAATSRTASPTPAIRSRARPALANLDIIEREKLVERVRDDVGPRFQAAAAAASPATRRSARRAASALIGALELRRPPQGTHAARRAEHARPRRASARARGRRDRARHPRPGRDVAAARHHPRRARPPVRAARRARSTGSGRATERDGRNKQFYGTGREQSSPWVELVA